MYCLEELEEDEEAGCLLKFMKHAKSHTYHKHDLGYAFGGKGVGWEILHQTVKILTNTLI